MGKPWESVPCLNTELGNKVKPLKPAEVRQALCQAGLSPIGDKNELLKRLAIHYSTLTGGSSGKIKKVLKLPMLVQILLNKRALSRIKIEALFEKI